MNVFIRDLLVKEITHAVDEDAARLPPFQRQLQLIPVQSQIEAAFVTWIAHCLEADREAFCIAVLAAMAYFSGASDGIPGGICPFDCRMIPHESPNSNFKPT